MPMTMWEDIMGAVNVTGEVCSQQRRHSLSMTSMHSTAEPQKMRRCQENPLKEYGTLLSKEESNAIRRRPSADMWT
jgi:hypothetical protein